MKTLNILFWILSSVESMGKAVSVKADLTGIHKGRLSWYCQFCGNCVMFLRSKLVIFLTLAIYTSAEEAPLLCCVQADVLYLTPLWPGQEAELGGDKEGALSLFWSLDSHCSSKGQHKEFDPYPVTMSSWPIELYACWMFFPQLKFHVRT